MHQEKRILISGDSTTAVKRMMKFLAGRGTRPAREEERKERKERT